MKQYCIATAKHTNQRHVMTVSSLTTLCMIALPPSEMTKISMGDANFLDDIITRDGICQDCHDILETQ